MRGDGLAVLGNDVLDGGDGINTVDYGFDIRTEGVLVDLAGQSGGSMSGAETDTLFGIENIIGTAFDDTILGD